MNRRDFLHAAASGAAALASARTNAADTRAARKWTAAIIGHTGRGNYGHNLDLIFADVPGVEVVAVADPDPKGRAAAKQRCKARRDYADYHEMLEKERPQLVSIAPRWTDQHHAMVNAALAIGAHVYCEKPFTQTLAEADDLLAMAASGGRVIAVAHQGRLAPNTLLLKRRLAEGFIGELLEIRVHGKQDRRAGGEDMMVLATHQFDLVRFFAGDPLWCMARVLQGGREITRADVHPATENIGPIAGDEIEAMFALPRGVNVHYTSRARNAKSAGPWGMELIGSEGRVRVLNDVWIDALVWRGGPFTASGQTGEWIRLEMGAARSATEKGFPAANRRVVDDWLAAIEEHREPACSGLAAMKSLEMIHGVFAAGLSRGRVEFPLKNRQHPLA
ncbi:MAG: Gfo/Idh/MocA family oxidoreductase [Opitutaceae bacterium]|nr:Gfo/Idh/MocA family oxidoreductase [Opitutaceae bacterium]